MSFSGSADSDRSTNRMFGLAETDSDWTALRSPPLLTFSGDQPCSTATGRSMSAVASSLTKAVKGSRKPARAWNGAFILAALRAHALETTFSRLGFVAIGLHRPGRTAGVDWTDHIAAVNQVPWIGHHRREVR